MKIAMLFAGLLACGFCISVTSADEPAAETKPAEVSDKTLLLGTIWVGTSHQLPDKLTQELNAPAEGRIAFCSSILLARISDSDLWRAVERNDDRLGRRPHYDTDGLQQRHR